MGRAAILLIVSMNSGYAAVMNFNQNTFYSSFSLRALVERTSSRSGLDCSAGRVGGGVEAGGGGVGGRESRRHKGESLTCRMKAGAGEQFNEAEYIASLMEVVEGDITASGAKITGGEPLGTRGFYYEYSVGKGLGRIEVTGKQIGADYYSVKASLDEVEKKEE